MAWYTTLLSPLVDGIGGYFKEKQQIKAKQRERKDELELLKHQASIERVKQGDLTERDYDLLVLKQSASTIIDEIMIIWVLTLVTCLFIPTLAPYAIAGFTALGTVPVYFQLIFVGTFIAKLGLRFLFSGRTLFGKKIK